MFNTRCNFKWQLYSSNYDHIIVAETLVKGKYQDRKLTVQFFVEDKQDRKNATLSFEVDGNHNGDVLAITSGILRALQEFHEVEYSNLTSTPVSGIKSLKFEVPNNPADSNQLFSNRIKLYKRIANKFASGYGYSVVIESTDTNGILFTLERK